MIHCVFDYVLGLVFLSQRYRLKRKISQKDAEIAWTKLWKFDITHTGLFNHEI